MFDRILDYFIHLPYQVNTDRRLERGGSDIWRGTLPLIVNIFTGQIYTLIASVICTWQTHTIKLIDETSPQMVRPERGKAYRMYRLGEFTKRAFDNTKIHR